MQAHLKDIADPRSEPFTICQRVLNHCHELIYGDLPASGNPYSTLASLGLPGAIRKKIRPNVGPALIGIGLALAGAPAMPVLTHIMGEVAIEQGRMDDRGDDLRSLDNPEAIVRRPTNTSSESAQEDEKDSDGSEPEGESKPRSPVEVSVAVSQDPPTAVHPAIKSRSRRQTIAAQTSPALPLHLKDPRKARLSEDPFGQNDPPTMANASSPSPFQSTPTFSSMRHFRRPNSQNSVDILLQKYDSSAQQYLLRSHFCRSEVCQSTA